MSDIVAFAFEQSLCHAELILELQRLVALHADENSATMLIIEVFTIATSKVDILDREKYTL